MAKVNGAEQMEDFAKLLEEFDNGGDENTSIIDGIIVDIVNDEVLVDIKDKTEGVLNIDEITKDNKLIFNKGDSIKVAIIGSSAGRKRLSYKKAIRKEKTLNFIAQYDENTDYPAFEVRCISSNSNGFNVIDANEVEYFLPKSQNITKDRNLNGKKFKVKILKVNSDNVIVSRKKVSDEERKRKKELIDSIINGEQIKDGVVRKITSYGMFVDIGGIDGLVHYSEISYKGPVNPSSLYKEGDSVKVKIVNYDENKKHISLSIKSALNDPWEEIKDNLEVGDVLKVVVSNIENYGAFVDLGNDIEGFLHISEISWDKNIKNPKEYLKEGQEIEVEVIEIDFEQRRLRVSLRTLLPKPFDEFTTNFNEGDVVEGIVSTITNFGAFVKIGNIDGLLHNDDISWERAVSAKDSFKVGDSLKVKIRKIDPINSKISLSIKHLEESPVNLYLKEHKIGDIVEGKVSDIKDFGIFVSLSDNVDGFIKKEDLSDTDVQVGDSIKAALVNAKNGKIRLSVKRMDILKTREDLDKINSNDKITIGDIIKDQLN